jgi:hypothetical protein
MDIDRGVRLRARVDFEIDASVHWRAPMTSGVHCRVKRGTIFRMFSGGASGSIVATLENQRIEASFAGTEYTQPGYAGLSIVFTDTELGRLLERA